jgi:trigger factor
MKTSCETIKDCEIRLQASFDPDEVAKEYGETLALFAKSASIKGFRPGKAPKAMVERRFAKELAAAVAETLRDHGISAAARETKRVILGESDFQSDAYKPGEGMTFSIVAHVEPELDPVPSVKGIALDCPLDPAPMADRVEARLREQTLQLGTFEDADASHVLSDRDMVAVSYDSTVDGRPLLEVAPDAKELAHSDEMWLVLDGQYATIPAFIPALIGKKIGDTATVTTSFDNPHIAPALRGKDIVFSITVTKARKLVPAALDDAFFSKIGVKDEADLRARIADAIGREDSFRIESQNRVALANALFRDPPTPAPLPRVASLNRIIFYYVAGHLARSRMPIDALRKRLAAMQPAISAAADRYASLLTLLLAVARAENITVDAAELEARAKHAALEAGYAHLKDWARRTGFEESHLRDFVAENLAAEKVLRTAERNAALSGPGKDLAAKLYADPARPLPSFESLAAVILSTLPSSLFEDHDHDGHDHDHDHA